MNRTGKCSSWNKGLTKETNPSILRSSELLKKRFADGEITPWQKGKKISDEVRKKISESMKKAHSEGRHRGWGFKNEDSNNRSYPEKFFIQLMTWHHLYENHLITENKPFGKYFLDFAFENEHVDVEIDGQQHKRTLEAIQHDEERDEFVMANGWRVYRIDWKILKGNPKNEIEKFKVFLQSDEIQRYSLKLTFEDFQQKQKEVFICPECGEEKKSEDSKLCPSCFAKSRRKVERPTNEELENLVKELPMTKIGKMFGVSDNSIRKWLKVYKKINERVAGSNPVRDTNVLEYKWKMNQ